MPPTPDSSNQDSAPDPREAIQEILGAIRRNLARVVFTTLVFLMLGIGLNMIWPNKYKSTTQFKLNESKIVTDQAVMAELEDIPLARKLLSLKNELQSSKRISAVMDELAWVEWLGTHGRPAQRRALLEKVRDNLDVEMTPDVTGAVIVTLGFQWTSPETAAGFVNRKRDAWIKLVLDSYRKGVEKRASDSLSIVVERETSFDAALAARRKYELENDVPSLLDTEHNTKLKAELILKKAEAQGQLESVVSAIEVLQAKLQATEKYREVEVPPDNPEQGVAMLAVREATAVFVSVDDDYREGHWRWNEAKKALDKAEKALEDAGGAPEERLTTETNPAYYDLGEQHLEKKAKEREYMALVELYDEQLDQVEDRLSRLPQVMMDTARLDADVEAAGELLAVAKLNIQPLKDQLKALRNANSVLSGAGGLISMGPFEIIEQGIEPDQPVMPIGAVIMALAVLVGIGVGLSGPVLAELTRSSFSSVKEVSRSLGVPVLGAVDLILTARDVRARKVQSGLTIATMALVLLALGTALWIYGYRREVLPATVLRALQKMRMALT
jgi:capsular polysaccharide biosynthesis protein